jgi:hypothetical protein
MISAAELATMQDAAGITLRGLATIRRFTTPGTVDDFGTVAKDWAIIAQEVPCEVAPTAFVPTERLAGGAIAAEARWSINFPSGTDITERDEVDIAGQTYEITAVSSPTSSEILCRTLAKTVDR